MDNKELIKRLVNRSRIANMPADEARALKDALTDPGFSSVGILFNSALSAVNARLYQLGVRDSPSNKTMTIPVSKRLARNCARPRHQGSKS